MPHPKGEPLCPKSPQGQGQSPEPRGLIVPPLVSEPIEGITELAGHPEFWRAFMEQPGGGPQLQLEHGAGPRAAHRHPKLLQWYSPVLAHSAAPTLPDPPLVLILIFDPDPGVQGSFCPLLLEQRGEGRGRRPAPKLEGPGHEVGFEQRP